MLPKYPLVSTRGVNAINYDPQNGGPDDIIIRILVTSKIKIEPYNKEFIKLISASYNPGVADSDNNNDLPPFPRRQAPTLDPLNDKNYYQLPEHPSPTRET